MKFAIAKTAQECQLRGVRVEIEKVDTTTRAVTLTDADGKVLRIERGQTYGSDINVLIPQPFDVEERWLVKYEIDGVEIKKFFDSDYNAQSHAEKLDRDHSIKAERTHVKVQVDDTAKELADTEIPL